MPDVSIAISAKDNFSAAIRKMQETTRPFTKELDSLQGQLDALNKNKVSLKLEMDAAKSKLKSARKEFDALADAAEDSEERIAAAARLTEAQEALEQVQRNYQLVSKQIRQTEKDMIDGGGTMDKQATRMQSSQDGLLKSLSKAGLGNMIGQSISGLAEYSILSAFGKPEATYLGGAVSGMVSGAAMGSVAGPMGTAIGAAVGAASGALNAYTQVQSEKDDAYKSFLQAQAEGIWEERRETLTSGSAIAGSREQTRMAFAQRFGSEEAADEYLDRVKTMAMDTNYEYDEITGYSKSLLNSYDPDAVFGVLQSLSDATAGLNLSSSDVNMMIAGLSRMRTTNKATSEYLNYFSERGVDVYQALADATGADKSRIADMVTGGDISGVDAAQAILDYINETYGGLSEKLAATYDAMVDNLGDYEAELEASMGEGYNETRKQGIQNQMDFLDGETGQKMQEAYRAMGAWQAELENKKEEYIRNAITDAINSDEYRDAESNDDAAEMGRIIAQAQVDGQCEYLANEGKDIELQSQLDLIDSLQSDENLLAAYETAGYTLGNALSKGSLKGYGDGIKGYLSEMAGQISADVSNAWAAFKAAGGGTQADESSPNSHAFGLNRVPYDGYPAMLHENERVLTANQARQQDAGGTGNVTIAGGNYYIREEADIDKVAEALAKKILLAKATARP